MNYPMTNLPDLRVARREGFLRRWWHERGGPWRGLSYERRCRHRRTLYQPDGGETCQRCGARNLVTYYI